MITTENIMNHELFISSIKEVNKISKQMKNLDGEAPHNHHHLLLVIKEILGDKCKNYLEIGVAAGGSMLSVMKSKFKTNYYGIDLFDHEYVIPKNNQTVQEKVSEIIDTLNYNNCKYTLIKGDSASLTTKTIVKNIQGGIDLFFIDGNHTQQYVNNDFHLYEEYVNKGGIIVFDDDITAEHMPSNYKEITPIIYTHKQSELNLSNTDEKGNIIHKYNSPTDDIINRANWSRIFVKE
jgi:predicted O-methyltransferase YrrM